MSAHGDNCFLRLEKTCRLIKCCIKFGYATNVPVCQVTDDGTPNSFAALVRGHVAARCFARWLDASHALWFPPVTNDGCGRTIVLGLYSGSTLSSGGVLKLFVGVS